jgi:hypothetical protein
MIIPKHQEPPDKAEAVNITKKCKYYTLCRVLTLERADAG